MTDLQDPPAPGEATPEQPPQGAEAVLAQLRHKPVVGHAFAGFGPLVAAAVLVVAMVLLAPSVAPEQDVEQLIDDPEHEFEQLIGDPDAEEDEQ